MTRFEPAPGLNETVAARIALPAVRRLAVQVRDHAQRNAPDGKVWVTAHDERVRPSHVHADGQVVPDNLRYLVPKVNTGNDVNDIRAGYDQARAPRDPALPIGNRINCFPADVEVMAEGVVGGYRRWYEGPMVTVRTASGRVLTGTPNHPVLTRRGWVGLGSLDVGSDHVYALVGDDQAGAVLPAEPDIERRPAPIGEVVGALAKTGLTHRVRGGLVDFHGDGCDSDVDVVRTDGLLLDDREAARAQGVSDPLLAVADPRAGLLPRKGLARLLRVARAALGAPGLLGGQRPLRALLRAGGRHPLRHRGATASDGHASVAEDAVEPRASAALLASKALGGLPGEVTLDQVVASVVRQDWRGHVYNLETISGTYIGNGIITHNCRCVTVPLRGVIARAIVVEDAHAMGPRVSARVSGRFPRIVESEHPSDPDRGGGWFRRAAIETAASMPRR